MEYIRAYLSGVIISTSFVLYVNDMFYKQVFLRQDPYGNTIDIVEALRPREVFGEGAKTTFIKNQIQEEKGEDSQVFHDYINTKKESDNKFSNKFKSIFNNKKI